MTTINGAALAVMTRDQAKLLAHFAAGESIDEAANAAAMARSEAAAVLHRLTGNDRAVAQDLAVKWQRANRTATQDTTPPRVEADADLPRLKPAADTIAGLLARAIGSEAPKLVRLAAKVQELVDQLDAQVHEHEQAQELRAEAERLEQRLAEIKQQLTPKRPTSVLAGIPAANPPDSKAVRAWATTSNTPCPPRGRIPAAGLDAYRRATGGAAA